MDSNKNSSEFSDSLVKLFNDLSKKHDIQMPQLVLSMNGSGDELVVSHYCGDDILIDIENIKLNNL